MLWKVNSEPSVQFSNGAITLAKNEMLVPLIDLENGLSYTYILCKCFAIIYIYIAIYIIAIYILYIYNSKTLIPLY